MISQNNKITKTSRRKLAKTNSKKGKDWMGIIRWVAEVVTYLIIQVALAGLLIYEVAGYILYKIK